MVTIRAIGGKRMLFFYHMACIVQSRLHFFIFIYSLIFVCNYIYVECNVINNFICIMQFVIFKHLFFFLSMIESVIAWIPTSDLYNLSFTLFHSKAFAFSRLRVKSSINNKYNISILLTPTFGHRNFCYFSY
jgi:hypothetical protein